MSFKERCIICLMGPTAAGKTDTAFKLHEELPCDVISVDSAMIYQGMDIGSAKPSPKELAQVPHRLIDIRDVTQPYSAANFQADALCEIEAILANQRVPLLVGGTMLYYKTLIQGMNELPSADEATRKELEREREEHGLAYLHAELAKVDPSSAARIHPNDPQRLLRALEIYRVSGKTMTELTQTSAQPFPYRVIAIALAPEDRSFLHQRIEQRFTQMLDLGFEQEVCGFFERPDVHAELPAMKSVGYRQMWQYLDKQYDRSEMIEKAVIATRQLAKRQYTWLRSWPDLHWVESQDDPGKIFAKVLKIVKQSLI